MSLLRIRWPGRRHKQPREEDDDGGEIFIKFPFAPK
jgi:hypothetical protein